MSKRLKGKVLLVLSFIGGAIFFRSIYLAYPYLDSDQAITGLMARHILQGDFPIFFWGQSHCGALESYLAAIVFYLFGSSRFLLNLTPTLVSGLFIYIFYRLVLVILGPERTLYGLGLIALGPVYLTFHSVLARGCYIESLTLGGLILILTYSLAYSRVEGKRYFFPLGLISGISFWIHHFAIFYIIPAALFVWLKDKRIIFKRDFLFILGGFFLGSLPFWIYNLQHNFVSFYGRPRYNANILESLYQLFWRRIPTILGVHLDDNTIGLIPYFSHIIGVLFAISLFFTLVERRRGLLSLLKGSLSGTNGMEIILVFFTGYILVFSLTGVAEAHTSRYLLPLYYVFIVTMTYFLYEVRRYSKILATLLFISILFSNSYGNIAFSQVFNPERAERYKIERTNDKKLLDLLKKEGVRFVYALSHWDAYKLTFDAQEDIIFAILFYRGDPGYLQMVDASTNIAYLIRGEGSRMIFEENLNGIGGAYKKSSVGGYTVFYDFTPPSSNLVEIKPDGWSAIANHNNEDANKSFDRDISTRWTSFIPQKPGIFYQVDLGRIYHNVSKISFLPGVSKEVPRGYILEVSIDGKRWEQIKVIQEYWGPFFWSGPHPFVEDKDGRVEIAFSPTDLRFFRITQTNRSNYFWSIHEIFVYEATKNLHYQELNPDPIIDYLKENKNENVFADFWLDAFITNKIGEKVRNRETTRAIDFFQAPIFVMERNNANIFKEYLHSDLMKVDYKERGLGGYAIFHSFNISKQKGEKISSLPCAATANYNQEESKYAIDGDINTTWSTNFHQEPGMYLQLDLCKTYNITKLELSTGSYINDYPRGFQLEISRDGYNWGKISVQQDNSRFYWSGTHLLKNQHNRVGYVFDPVLTRYIKITLTDKHPIFNWAISEIAVYQ